MNNQYIRLLIYSIVCITSIFVNGYYRCKYNGGNDKLMKKLNIYDLDGWSITHFGYHMLIGYTFPNMFIEAMILGIIWELWEQYYGKNAGKTLIGIANCKLGTDSTDSNEDNWWFGRVSDIIMNLLGFMLGQYIKTKKVYIKE